MSEGPHPPLKDRQTNFYINYKKLTVNCGLSRLRITGIFVTLPLGLLTFTLCKRHKIAKMSTILIYKSFIL